MTAAVEMIKTIRERWVHPVYPTTTLSWHLVSTDDDKNPGYIYPNSNFIEVDYQGKKFKLRTLYDIVGWIFSVVGYAPVGATRENYYYPLMMIAYNFCKQPM